MDTYTKVLEFFMENGVHLNSDQMDDLYIVCNEKATKEEKEALKAKKAAEKAAAKEEKDARSGEEKIRSTLVKDTTNIILDEFKRLRMPLRQFGISFQPVDKKSFIEGKSDTLMFTTAFVGLRGYSQVGYATIQGQENFRRVVEMGRKNVEDGIKDAASKADLKFKRYYEDGGYLVVEFG